MTSIEPPGIVAEYYMARVYNKTYLMLEGKTDEDTWGRFFAPQCCYIHPLPYGEGKEKIMAALKMELSGAKGVAGLVDADYWLITDSHELQTKNLVYDCYFPDSEMVLLSSPTLVDVFNATLEAPFKQQVGELVETLKKQGERLAIEFGYFRLLNHLNDYGLSCNAIRLHDVIDAETLELDRVLVASRLTGDMPGLTSERLLTEVDELRETYPPNNIQLCRGKDALAIIAHLLPTHFQMEFGMELPSTANKLEDERVLGRHLRCHYKGEYFVETALRCCIRSWESANTPYKILKPDI